MERKLYQEIASMMSARENCVKDDDTSKHNTVWFERHSKRLEFIQDNCLPSGSGIDSGCEIDLVRSKPERIVISLGYHHMSEHGYYDGWTYHDVVITPSLQFGYNLRITGRDRNQIKDYLYDTLANELDGNFSEYLDGLMVDFYGGE